MRPEPPRLGLVVQGKMEGYVLLAQIQVMVGGRRIQTPWQDCLYGHVMAGAGLVTGDVVAVKSLRREEVDKKRTGSGTMSTTTRFKHPLVYRHAFTNSTMQIYPKPHLPRSFSLLYCTAVRI